jgi:hypothetical protein
MSARDDAADSASQQVQRLGVALRNRVKDLGLCLRVLQAVCREASVPFPPVSIEPEHWLMLDELDEAWLGLLEGLATQLSVMRAQSDDRAFAKELRGRAGKAALRAFRHARQAKEEFRAAMQIQLASVPRVTPRPTLTVLPGRLTRCSDRPSAHKVDPSRKSSSRRMHKVP